MTVGPGNPWWAHTTDGIDAVSGAGHRSDCRPARSNGARRLRAKHDRRREDQPARTLTDPPLTAGEFTLYAERSGLALTCLRDQAPFFSGA